MSETEDQGSEEITPSEFDQVVSRLQSRHQRSTIRVKDGRATYYCKCFQPWPCDVQRLLGMTLTALAEDEVLNV